MQLSSLALISLGELLLVTTIASILMLVVAVVRNRRDRSAAESLIARIKEDEGRRDAKTRALLEQNIGLVGEGLETVVRTIGREEQRFYQTLINLYLKRDAGALENLQVAFDGATEPYRSLEVLRGEESGEIVPVVLEPVEGGDSAELDRLTGENERLSEELSITMDTMGRMLSEYSSMCAGDSGKAVDKEKMLEMFRGDAVTARAEKDQVSPDAVGQPTQVGGEEDDIHLEIEATIQEAIPEMTGGDLFGSSAVADLQSKMDDLGVDAAVAAGGGDQPLMAADDDPVALENGSEIVPEGAIEDELEETELINLDAVLERRA